MRAHFLVLLLLPIVHGQQFGKLRLINPFRNIFPTPSVQFYQLSSGNDDRRNDNRLVIPTLFDKCEAKIGFYIDGHCYKYFNNPLEWEEARDACSAIGGSLWLPNFDDPFLYHKIVEVTSGLPPPNIWQAANGRIWVGIKNNRDVLGTPVGNHLTVVAGGIPNCGELVFTTGAFLIDDVLCDVDHHYVCELPL